MDHRYLAHTGVHKYMMHCDMRRMRAVFTLPSDGETDEESTVELPIRFEVCSVCDGRAVYVSPSIDAHGISQEEFDADPCFRDDYFSGVYDVTCARCKGERVEPVINEAALSAEQKELLAVLQERVADDQAYERECARELAMGY